MRLKLVLGLLLFSLPALAQENEKVWRWDAYMEAYYGYDFSKPKNHERAAYLYNHKRHNEINYNLVYGKLNYQKDRVRSTMGLMVGNYAQYNLATEPTWAQFVYEATIGYRLSKKYNTWIDVGIMPSHIGFESAVSADCYTASRSLLAENSPYYESGLKWSYTDAKEKILLSVLVLNGWQRIQRPEGFEKPALGVQVNWKPVENVQLNYSNFLGSDKADSVNAPRMFHNFYAIIETHPKFQAILGFDIGSESSSTTIPTIWYSPVVIARYKINNKYRIAFRAEYYRDKYGVIIPVPMQNGFGLSAFSLNTDIALTPKFLFRVEGKWYHTAVDFFKPQQGKNSQSLLSTLSWRL